MKKAEKSTTVRAAVKKTSLKDLSVSTKAGGVKGGRLNHTCCSK